MNLSVCLSVTIQAFELLTQLKIMKIVEKKNVRHILFTLNKNHKNQLIYSNSSQSAASIFKVSNG